MNEMYNQQQPFFANQQPQSPYYNQFGYGTPMGYGAPMGYGYGQMPANMPPAEASLSKEEYEELVGKKAQTYAITKNDAVAAKCNHRNPVSANHEIVLQLMSDGRAKCPICGAVFNPDEFNTDELRDANEIVKNAIQNIKTYQGIPKNVLEQYSIMIPMLDKLPIMLDKVRSIADGIGYNNLYNYNFANEFRATFDQYNNAIANGNINFYQQFGQYQPQQGFYQPQAVMGQPPMGQQYPQQGYQQQPVMGQPVMGQPQYPQGYQQQPMMGQPQQGFIPQLNPFAAPPMGQPQQAPVGNPQQAAPVGVAPQQAAPTGAQPQQAPVGAQPQQETVVTKQFTI